jgi:hypothetical protein
MFDPALPAHGKRPSFYQSTFEQDSKKDLRTGLPVN